MLLRMDFTILGALLSVETFAVQGAIRDLARLQRQYGKGRWRKRKGFAHVKLGNGNVLAAEVHWYEATGIGRFEFKIKRFLRSGL